MYIYIYVFTYIYVCMYIYICTYRVYPLTKKMLDMFLEINSLVPFCSSRAARVNLPVFILYD